MSSNLTSRTTRSSVAGLAVLLCAVVAPAGATASVPEARAAATGPNPFLIEAASPTSLDHAGWKARLPQLARQRAASPAYAAARTAAGLDVAPLTTSYADLAAALKQVGTAPGLQRRLRVTGLPTTFGSVDLHTVVGDVAVAAMTGPGDLFVEGGKTDGGAHASSPQGLNVSGLFPTSSPLLGTGDTSVVGVAAKLRGPDVAHRVRIGINSATAASTLDIELYTSPVAKPVNRVQTIVLDVDGARLDTTPYGGSGVSTLSPLASFLPAWGIPAGQQKALVRKAAALMQQQLTLGGAKVKVVTTLTDPDPWGAPNVARVVVGGTRAQTGVDAISASADLDPGNLVPEETSLLQLDVLSAPPTPALGMDDPSLLAWMDDSSDRVTFVARALANLAMHEVGHQIGLFNTEDALSSNRSVMDSGGHAVEHSFFLAGADHVGGTADDPVAGEPDLWNPDYFNRGEGLGYIERLEGSRDVFL